MRRQRFKYYNGPEKKRDYENFKNPRNCPNLDPVFFSLQHITSQILRDHGPLLEALIKMLSLFVPELACQ